MCFARFSAWPILLFCGIIATTPALRVYGGLSAALTLTFFYYLHLELRILLENPEEQQSRLKEHADEIIRHEVAAQHDEEVLGQMFPIKHYAGEPNTREAISDFGKLKVACIRCRIEGSLVKVP